MREQDTLFHKLFVGVKRDEEKGHKMKHIESKTNCAIDILGLSPMRIRVKIKCSPHTKSKSTQKLKQAIRMIEESLLEFLNEKNSEKRLLFELTSTATGHLLQSHNSTRFVLREYKGVSRWWSLLDLPCGRGKKYHGSFLRQAMRSGQEVSWKFLTSVEATRRKPLHDRVVR